MIGRGIKSVRTESEATRAGIAAYERALMQKVEQAKKETSKQEKQEGMLDFVLRQMNLRDSFTDKH